MVLALAPAAQAAIVVGTGTASISFNTATPLPATTAVGTGTVSDYGGIVTGHNGSGVPLLTLSTLNDTTVVETTADWDNTTNTVAAGMAPIGAWTFRDQNANNGNTWPAPFGLLGSVIPTAPTLTGPSAMTEFKITGLSFAVRDRSGYANIDAVTVNILDGLSNVVSTGTLEAIGASGGTTALNATSLDGGGIFSGDLVFDSATGHLIDTFTVQILSDGNWNNGNEGFWISLDGAELTVDYTVDAIPEPATMSLLALGGLAMLRRRRRA